jgi:hypothetical protein
MDRTLLQSFADSIAQARGEQSLTTQQVLHDANLKKTVGPKLYATLAEELSSSVNFFRQALLAHGCQNDLELKFNEREIEIRSSANPFVKFFLASQDYEGVFYGYYSAGPGSKPSTKNDQKIEIKLRIQPDQSVLFCFKERPYTSEEMAELIMSILFKPSCSTVL